MTENPRHPSTVLIAKPHGVCAGVEMAVAGLQALHHSRQEDTTFVYHEIVHNRSVVADFKKQGVVFIDNIDEAPPGATLMFSAHGVSRDVIQQGHARNLEMFDATCPLVKKPHQEAKRLAGQGYEIFYICHTAHDEAIGVIGEAPNAIIPIQTKEDALAVTAKDPDKVALLTQTTFSVMEVAEMTEILRQRFPGMWEPNASDICYATQHRQTAVKVIVEQGAEIVVVVGSQNSSNSKRLAEVALRAGAIRSYLVDKAEELDPNWFIGAEIVGLTSGASAPEECFIEVVNWFEGRGSRIQEVIGADERKIHFAPPMKLQTSKRPG